MEEQNQPPETIPATNETPPASTPTKNGTGKRRRAGIVIIVLIIAGTLAGLYWWAKSKTHIATDNAFVEATIYSISSKVSGTVINVPVKDNQLVTKGDVLAELNRDDNRVAVNNAEAELDMARNQTSGDYASIEKSRASVDLSRARLDQAELDLQRGKTLFSREVIPKEQLDRLETLRRVAELQLREETENLRKEQASVGLSGKGGREARIAQKLAKLEEARLNLSYTRIYAPADGYVTRKSVEPGNNVQGGQPLMAVVALHDTWVTANYKESQLTHVAPGQQVEFSIDAYPGQTFRGTVESIMAGTGAAFSLLPPENASGNYVKVVQRIPVKIAIDKRSDPEHRLRVGMSVVPTILTGQGLRGVLKELNPF